MKMIPSVLLLVFVLTALVGCSEGPPEFDGRRADITTCVQKRGSFIS